MKELIGKTVSGLRVNDDQSILVFDHPDGTHTAYRTYSECCSETWFADITGVNALIGQVVTAVEKVYMDAVDDGRTRQERDEFYGVKLTTIKGVADIVYRNSSNGYYGGDIDFYSDNLPSGIKPITDDWSA